MQLTLKKKLLLVVTVFLTGFFRLSIIFLPFRIMAKLMGAEGVETSCQRKDEDLQKIRAIGWAVSTVSRYTRWKSLCLVQALTAQLLLRIFSIPNTLYLGVAKDEQGRLIAHAWLRSGVDIVTGGDTMANFRAIICYGTPEGRRIKCR